MSDATFSRRAAILGAASLPVIRVVTAQPRRRNIVISSANGVAACAKALEMIQSGSDTLDAVIAGAAAESFGLEPEKVTRALFPSASFGRPAEGLIRT